MTLESLVTSYGVPALFIGCFLEGESVAITGGALVHRHTLKFLPVLLAISSGAWLADTAFFLLGRRFRSHPFVQRRLEGRRVAGLMARAGQHPDRLAAMFRFIPGMRILMPLALSHTAISYQRYAVITAASALLWALFYIVVGHLVGAALQQIVGHVHHLRIIVWGGTLIAAVSLVLGLRHLLKSGRAKP